MRFVLAALAVSMTCGACAGAPDEAGAGPEQVTLSFQPDEVAVGGEDYLCFTFDAVELRGQSVERITWSPPSGGGVTLHHGIVYAMQGPFPDGPFSCLAMPSDAVGLHIWAPGDQPLVMPEGFGLYVPESTTKMTVQAHVLRFTGAPAAVGSVTLTLADKPPEHLAAWHSTVATVPPILPHSEASATSGCRARAAVHTLFAWPHMHRLGTSFQSSVQRAAGGATPLADVPVWDVSGERTYPVTVDIDEGDVLQIGCTWENSGSTTVVGGYRTTDEMCTQGIISWPFDAPRCEPL
jgi:Copper type II ascorbate-dependent monooxygenase, C-terminal domain